MESLPLSEVTDLAEVAAKFATHGAGKIPIELSGELALDLVLNQIVEQACLATGASGAAIALRRGEDIVCRATCGTNAPQLGSRLQTGAGLSGACVRSAKIQSCDDAWNDDRADADLSRQLGVRSVVVYPLMSDKKVLGILEILSPLPSAFGARDLQTLEALASRIIKSTEAARKISVVPVVASPVNSAVAGEAVKARITDETSVHVPSPPFVQAETVESRSALLKPPADCVIRSRRHRRPDWFTLVLSVVILAIGLVMGAAFSVRVGWIKGTNPRSAHRLVTDSSSVVSTTVAKRENVSVGNIDSGKTSSTQTNTASTVPMSPEKKGAAVSEGTLFVYEDGKEIFRMAPTTGHGATTESKPELISRVEPEYPAQALAQRIQGAVALHLRVGADGGVQEVRVASGNPLLAEAAVAAVRQWRFKPHVLNGRPTATEAEIRLKFILPAN